MNGESTANPKTTEVEIFGSVYHVHGREDGEYLQEVASLVDRRMREVSAKVVTGDVGKVAILAALNLADELLQSRNRREGERVEIEERIAALTGELAAALAG